MGYDKKCAVIGIYKDLFPSRLCGVHHIQLLHTFPNWERFYMYFIHTNGNRIIT